MLRKTRGLLHLDRQKKKKKKLGKISDTGEINGNRQVGERIWTWQCA